MLTFEMINLIENGRNLITKIFWGNLSLWIQETPHGVLIQEIQLCLQELSNHVIGLKEILAFSVEVVYSPLHSSANPQEPLDPSQYQTIYFSDDWLAKGKLFA